MSVVIDAKYIKVLHEDLDSVNIVTEAEEDLLTEDNDNIVTE